MAGGGGVFATPTLPNVPVFAVGIDESLGRVYAATHGRGMFVLTGPSVWTNEGWVKGGIWDIPTHGHGFPTNQSSCTVTVKKQDGSTCSSGTKDAQGNVIGTDDKGVLVTSSASKGQAPIVWACYEGICSGGVDLMKNCSDPKNPISTVIVDCGGTVGISRVNNCPELDSPPSGSLSVFDPKPGGGASPPPPPSGNGNSSFSLFPTVQDGSGFTRALCAVEVTMGSGDTPATVMEHAAPVAPRRPRRPGFQAIERQSTPKTRRRRCRV
jgi:hypothetical protein